MNVKFGMDNFYTRYLKRFLNHHLTRSKSVLGEFKVEDLRSLIKYLNFPNTATIFEMQKYLVNKFNTLRNLFTITMESTEIVLTSKEINSVTSDFVQNNLSEINDFCKLYGWKIGEVSNWIDSNYDINR